MLKAPSLVTLVERAGTESKRRRKERRKKEKKNKAWDKVVVDELGVALTL